MSENNQNSRIYGIIVSLLLLAAAALGYFFWQKSQNLLAESQRIEVEKAALESEKAGIERSLDSLSTAHGVHRRQRQPLTTDVSSPGVRVSQK